MDDRYRKLTAWAAILSLPLAYSTLVLSFITIGGNIQAFNQALTQNTTLTLPILAQRPLLLWWTSLLDFFGFYLLLLPLALYLHYLFHTQNPEWSNLFTVCGLGYILLGAVGAAVLAFVFSEQAAKYAGGTELERQIATAIFTAFGYAIQRGVWGILDPLLAGVWWLGNGWLLKESRSRLGWFTMLLGIVSVINGFGEVTRLDAVTILGLGTYFLLAPFWAGWIGLEILRNPPDR